MDAKTFLEQMLQSAKNLSVQGRDIAEKQLGVPEAGEQRDAMLSGMGKGALAAGALALLLGTGAGRRITGSAIKLGGLAAVGAVAYKAYQNWQGGSADDATTPGVPIDQLSGSQAQARSEVLLEAMINAAMADGHIDVAERQQIDRQVEQLGLGQDTASFIQARLADPTKISELAAKADSTEAAAEIYLVSRLLIDPNNAAEKNYIDRLAVQLQLDPDLLHELERQIDAA